MHTFWTHLISCAISRLEKRGLHKCIARFPAKKIWHTPSPDRLTPENVRPTAYAVVTTKISRMDRLPNFLSNGAPLARTSCARRAPLSSSWRQVTGSHISYKMWHSTLFSLPGDGQEEFRSRDYQHFSDACMDNQIFLPIPYKKGKKLVRQLNSFRYVLE